MAKGTYNATSGEVFPLQLKPGVTLVGEGFWWMGIKVIKETFIEGTAPVILGADNASIISCYVRPTAWGSSVVGIDDDGHPMEIFHCTIDGDSLPSGQGVRFMAGSSLLDSRVENFDGPAGRAVGVYGTGGALIHGNVILNHSGGIYFSASNVTVSDNRVEDITSVGIVFGTIDYVTDNILLLRNYISNTGGNGVQASNVDDVEILHNSISHTGGYGIAINQQQPAYMVDIKNNSITHGSSLAIWLIDGGANINGNTFVCNVAGVFVRTDQVIDLRLNSWDNDPPIISDGRGPIDAGCDLPYDICYESQYALTPAPIYQPDHGKGTCLIGVVPSPRE